MIEDVNQLINGENVYKNVLPNHDEKFKIKHCGLGPGIFDAILKAIPSPELIVEVGSWHGTSAIHMAQILKERQLNTKIICVDTFLGSYFHRTSAEWRPQLLMKQGRATLYEDFLGNVVAHNVQDVIIPYVGTSIDAARFLKHYVINCDIVFVDGSHESPDVYLDLASYWQVLKGGGVIFGDDFHESNMGVIKDVIQFCQQVRIQPEIMNCKFIVAKPKN